MNSRIDSIIQKLELIPHPEGGYFRETYRGTLQIDRANLGGEYSGKRDCSTCIYFLLTSDTFSSFHRITQDEIWHFYQGSPIMLHLIAPNGDYQNTVIGNDFEKGQLPQIVVPGGYWFAAAVLNEEDYSLVGCTVSPGFDFEDFELARRGELIDAFPHHEELITKFTRM